MYDTASVVCPDTDSSSSLALLEQFNAGSPEALDRLHGQYDTFVRRVLRRHALPPRSPLRRELDEADLAQLVWADMLRAIRNGKYVLVAPAQLTRFLKRVAILRGRFELRKRIGTAKRSLDRLESFYLTMLELAGTDREPWEDTALAEELAAFVQSAPAEHQAVLQLKIDGCPVKRIAEHLGLHLRKVYRILEEEAARLKERLVRPQGSKLGLLVFW